MSRNIYLILVVDLVFSLMLKNGHIRLFSFLGPYPSLDFFKKIDSFVGPQLTTLANVIGEQSAKKQQRY